MTLSLSHTSMMPHFVAVNMKSLFTLHCCTSKPVAKVPTTALLDSLNTWCNGKRYLSIIYLQGNTQGLKVQLIFSIDGLPFLRYHQQMIHRHTTARLGFVRSALFVCLIASWLQSRMLMTYVFLNLPPVYHRHDF